MLKPLSVLAERLLRRLLTLGAGTFIALAAAAAPALAVDLTCTNGTESLSATEISVNGPGSASVQLVVKSAPVGTRVTFTYKATNGVERTVDANLSSGSATQPVRPNTTNSSPISLEDNGDTGSQTSDVTGTGNITYTITIATTENGTSKLDWKAECKPLSKSFTAVKSTTATSYSAVGNVLPYTIKVTNTGESVLTGLTITDPLTSNEACPVTQLAPGANTICTASYTVTQADLDKGTIKNTATVDTDQTAPKDTNEVVLDATGISPSLTAVKSTTATGYSSVGDVLPYKIKVTNTGNVTLTGLTISDPLTSNEACPVTQPAPGANTTCTASYTVTQADLDSGTIKNTATVDTDQTAPKDTNEVVLDATGISPSLTAVKSTTATGYSSVGDVLPYKIKVTNTGNVTLTGLTISDPLTGNEACPVTQLAPGANTICTASYTVTQADLDKGTIKNTATVDTDQTAPKDTNEVVLDATGTEASLTAVKSTTATSFATVGETISYDITVTNTGNLTLTNLSIEDALTSDETCPAAPLAPGKDTICTASYTVTQADLDKGTIKNTATVDTDQTAPKDTNEVVLDATGTEASLTAVKSTTATSFATVGETISYDITVTNTGNLTLTNLSIEDALTSDETCPAAPLAPGKDTICTASYTVTQADLDEGTIKNTATVDTDQTAPKDTNEVVLDATGTEASLTAVKSTTATSFATVGETISYDITVTNTGNLTLTNLSIEDALTSDETCPAAPLAPGKDTICTASYTVTQADLDEGTIKNTATVDSDQTAPKDTNEVVLDATGTEASLTAVKSTTATSFATVGETISYDITVTNTGNLTLTNLSIEDALTSDETCPAAPLAPGKDTTCTASYTVTQADLDEGTIKNTATVDTDQTAPKDTNEVVLDATGTEASLTAVKSTTATSFATVGETISYDITVTNTGNLTLTNLSIEDALTSDETCPAAPLAPGKDTICTASYTVTQADLDKGTIKNTATVDTDQTAPKDTNEVVLDATGTEASLTAVKSTTATSFATVGETISYDITVTNTGNLTLTNLSIEDALTSDETCPAAPLAPGKDTICTASYTVTQADLDEGTIKNTATVDSDQTAPKDTNEVVLDATGTEASLTAVKSTTATSFATVGETISYDITVTNTGNLTLTNLSIEDALTSDETCPAAPLAPGKDTTCTASYTVTQADLDEGTIKNTATVDSDQTAPKDTNEVVLDATGQSTSLSITKSASPNSYSAINQVIDYTIKVENTGNITLTGVTISDPMLSLTCEVGTLAPGDSQDCTGKYTTTQANIDKGRIENTATADSDQTDAVSDTLVIFDPQPEGGSLTAVKSVAQASFSTVGEVLDYSILVTNNGTTTLTALTVEDQLTKDESCPVSELAPGANTTCTATYEVTQADLDKGSISNTASVSATGVSPQSTNTVTINAAAVTCPAQGASPNLASTRGLRVDNGPQPSLMAASAELSPTAQEDTVPPCDVADEIVRADMKSLSHNFLAERINLLSSNGPRLAWRNNRADRFSAGANGFQVTGVDGDLTGNFAFSTGGIRKALKGDQIVPTADVPTGDESAINAWVEGNFAVYGDDRQDENAQGDFFVGYAGIDLRVHEKVNIGVMGEIDWMRENGDQDARVSGTGWMVGPYLSAELSHGLFLDIRAMGGQSSNDIRQISSEFKYNEIVSKEHEGTFDTNRWLAEATLSGNYDLESVTLTPDLRLLYIREDQLDYTVKCVCKVTDVDGQTVQLGQLSSGLRVSKLYESADVAYRPYVAGRLFWNFENPGELTVDGEYVSTDEFRGAVTLGLDARSDQLLLGVEGTYDGLFADGDYALEGKLSLGYKF